MLAVTTDLPALSAVSTARLAGSPSPPMTSTKTSIDGVARQRHRIGEPAEFFDIEVALLAARARAQRDDLDRAAAARDELVASLVQEANHGAADGSKPGKTDFQRLSHRTSPT